MEAHFASMATMQRAHEMFNAACARYPNAPALLKTEDGEKTMLTYEQLMTWARAVFEALVNRIDCSSNALVGVFIDRAFSFFAAVMGIHMTGLAYVPVSTKYGKDRIQYILDFAEPLITVSVDPYQEQLLELGKEVLDITPGENFDATTPREAKDLFGNPDGSDIAYVIFTSGTTGRPKGVMIEHRSLCNMMREKFDAYKATEGDRVLQFFDIAFDGSIIDYMPTLAAGAALILWGGGLDQAIKAASDHQATHAMMTTSAMNYFEPASHWKLMSQGGEACPVELAVKWAQTTKFQNFYGPTEAAAFVTWKQYEIGEKAVTIGPTIRNCITVVLDDSLNEVKPGEVGELCFGGICLARGYWNDPERTAEKFIDHPTFGKLYLSGDLGMIDHEGTHGGAKGDIHIKGRKDEQVKVQGVRIELQEVEQVLLENPKVKDAAVLLYDQNLIAFVTPTAEAKKVGGKEGLPGKEELISLCQERLPNAAVPTSIYLLKKMPLTSNDKIDKRALIEKDEALDTRSAEDAPQLALNDHLRAADPREEGKLPKVDEVLNALCCVKGARTVKHEDGMVYAFLGGDHKHTNEELGAIKAHLAMRLPKAKIDHFLSIQAPIPKKCPKGYTLTRWYWQMACKIRDMGLGVDLELQIDCTSGPVRPVPYFEWGVLGNGALATRHVPTQKVPEQWWENFKVWKKEMDEWAEIRAERRKKATYVPYSRNPEVYGD